MENKINKDEYLQEFYLKEYEHLRNEILQVTQEITKISQWVVIIIGSLWLWLLMNDNSSIPTISYWLPFLISGLGAIRTYNLNQNIKLMADYIKKMENYFCGNKIPQGWERFLSENRKLKFTISAAIFWPILILLTFIAPFVIKL